MNRIHYWENQTMDEYLFERFREDKIECEIESMMAKNKEMISKPSNVTRSINDLNKPRVLITKCNECPVFEGWLDPLGLPVVHCRLMNELGHGSSAIDLFHMVHHENKPFYLSITIDHK